MTFAIVEKRPTERSFGVVFTGFFAIVAFYPLIKGESAKMWAIYLSTAFAIITLIRPIWLKPLNILWYKFGLLLHRIISPLVMGVIFFFVVTPTGIFMRLRGRDILRLCLNKGETSYWILRAPPGPDPKTMTNQF